jgi:HTH-type transcriptional regulator/antitoxin HipB
MKIASPQTLGTVIKDERKKKGLSQENLGKMVGVDQTTVSYIENGKPGVRLSTILLLLAALELDLLIQPRTAEQQMPSGDRW